MLFALLVSACPERYIMDIIKVSKIKRRIRPFRLKYQILLIRNVEEKGVWLQNVV